MAIKTARLPIAILAAALATPAALFFVAAIGRSLQSTTHEPSRTLDAVVTWFGGLAGPWLLGLLVLLPFVGLLIATTVLWRGWTTDSSLRSDLSALGQAIRPVARRPALIVAALVVLFAVVYFTALLLHGIAG